VVVQVEADAALGRRRSPLVRLLRDPLVEAQRLRLAEAGDQPGGDRHCGGAGVRQSERLGGVERRLHVGAAEQRGAPLMESDGAQPERIEQRPHLLRRSNSPASSTSR
jgi:hypothetical protein